MKALIIVDDKELEVNCELFSIEYNQYKKYDIVYKFITKGKEERKVKQVAQDVRIPSMKGILQETFKPIKLKDSLEKEVISMYRKGNNTKFIDRIDESKYDIIIANQLIETEFFLTSISGNFNRCVQTFFTLEKQLCVDPDLKVERFLFVVKEPEVVMNSDNSEIKIREVVTVVKKKFSGKIVVEGKGNV